MTKIINFFVSDLSGLLIKSKNPIEVQELIDSINTESVEETWKRDMERIGADMWNASSGM